ncbi:hypothetical protein [Pseudonocardia sp. GCM10023141]|uniref:hypothetical protein n=1 Tax=Pseudonocardia sp. GCM10023141 TaxID=3252653 RepID=UPI0036187192
MSAAAEDRAPHVMAARQCSIPGCDGAHLARGWCRTHYVRWQRHGDPLAAVPVVARVRDQVTYAAARRLVVAARGAAGQHRCADCQDAAVLWAYDGTDPDEREESGRGRRFSADPQRYRARCRSCHRRAIQSHRPPLISGRDVDRVVRLYRAGASARGIAALLRVSPGAVLTTLRAHGVAIRPGLRRGAHTGQ